MKIRYSHHGNCNEIEIILDADKSFDEIKNDLQKKTADSPDFFAGADANVSFLGRELSKDEHNELMDILQIETGIALTKPPELPPPVIPQALGKAAFSEGEVAFYRGNLRNGEFIRHNGSVIVMGDVNGGSKIEAGGNVVIMGALKGTAHAGLNGNDKCFVSALVMEPVQLRIANLIGNVPPNDNHTAKVSYAYLKNGKITVNTSAHK